MQTAERQAGVHQRPPKPFQQCLKCSERSSNTNPTATVEEPPAPTHKSPSSPKAEGWRVSTLRNKENAIITCTGIWRDCLCIPQKLKGFLVYQCAKTELNKPLVLRHHSQLPRSNIIAGVTLHLFLAAAQLQTAFLTPSPSPSVDVQSSSKLLGRHEEEFCKLWLICI